METSGDSVMAFVLKNIEANIVAGIRDAQAAGVQCKMPAEIEVDMAIDSNGLPCTQIGARAAGRIKTTILVSGKSEP
jgi:hypothetical protein